MWQRFTETARKTIVRAESHAAYAESAQVETEHLLLALVDGAESPGAHILAQAGVTADAVGALLKTESTFRSLQYMLFPTEVEKLSTEFQVDAVLVRRIESRSLFKLRGQTQRPELKLSESLKRALELASDEARQTEEIIQRPCDIGAEHLLLGLLRDKDGKAAEILNNLGVRLEETRTAVIELSRTQGAESAGG